MNITKRIAIVTGLTGAVLAVAGTTTHAMGDASTLDPRQVTVPSDWVSLVDDTNTITLAVPGAWTDISTAALVVNTGAQLPAIQASPNLAAYWDTFDVPGVVFAAEPYTPDTAALAEDWGLTSGCASMASEAYNDGAFVGTHLSYTGCGQSGTAEFHVIAASPADQSFTAALQIQITGPSEYPVIDGVLASFNVAGSTATTPTAPVTAPTSTVAPTPVPASTGTDPAIVTAFQQELAANGLNVTFEQASCLWDGVAGVNTQDQAAMQVLFATCGVA